MAARTQSAFIPMCACAALCVVVTVTLTVTLTNPATVTDPTILHTVRGVEQLDAPTLLPRVSSHLIYWTPHKTGSTSMRRWTKTAGRLLKIPVRPYDQYYPFSNVTDFPARTAFPDNASCSMVGGHIRVPRFDRRFHEGTLGAVVTTTRDVVDTLISKYFHRTAHSLGVELRRMVRPNTTASRDWFFYWHDYDPCEPLRYYDGAEGCVLASLPQRVDRIAQRIDCVVDTEDPDQDVGALCVAMGIEECPEFPFANSAWRSLYGKVRTMDHLIRQLDRVVNVYVMLREALLKRRCRFLANGTLTTPGLEPPRWPRRGCYQRPKIR